VARHYGLRVHSPEFMSVNDGPLELRVTYALNDQGNADAYEMNVVTVDPELSERATVPVPTQVGVTHEGVDEDEDGVADWIPVYQFPTATPDETWRALWIGADECGLHSPHRRTHDRPRMLVANKQAGLTEILDDGVHWMTSGSYTTIKDWQSSIRRNGNKLYPMIELRSLADDGRVPNSTRVRIRTGATDQKGFVMSLWRQSGPDGNGTYRYFPQLGSEPTIGPATDSSAHIIGVSQSDEDVDEYTTHDNSDPSDSNGISYGHVRGYGRAYENEDQTTLWANLEYLQRAGIEKVYVESLANRKAKDVIAANNQADLLYFSGHGWAATGKIFASPQLPDTAPPGGGVGYADINPAVNWQTDLDVFIISACSVLNIRDKTGHHASPGLEWANHCIAGRTPGGPLDALCGYHHYAPADGPPDWLTKKIAQGFTSRFTGSNAIEAWREAHNSQGVDMDWCAMDNSTYYWHSRTLLWWDDHHESY